MKDVVLSGNHYKPFSLFSKTVCLSPPLNYLRVSPPGNQRNLSEINADIVEFCPKIIPGHATKFNVVFRNHIFRFKNSCRLCCFIPDRFIVFDSSVS